MSLPTREVERLRHSCEERIDSLGLPHRFTTRQLRDAIARLRDRPIILKPLRTLGTVEAPCGIRLETPGADLLFYEEGTSLLHQRHILTHELCHVLCDHPGSLEVDVETAHALGFNPTLILRMSGRTSYATDDEREAEMMATVIRQRIYRGREQPASRPAEGAERWEALFAKPRRKARYRPW